LLVAIPLLALIGVGAFVGYSYWEYRTFWGDPNVPPSDVTSLAGPIGGPEPGSKRPKTGLSVP